ncbi:MAG: BON domain-containing protein [Pirellulaceae bacterium]|nr:BON domain-containing protein [Pirellulaceae bacterium]
MLKGAYLLILFAVILMSDAAAEAQLFGSRSFGQPLQRRVGPARFSGAGDLQGSERFLRRNRGRADFVGSDQREQQGFVGSEQARVTGRVMSSIAGLRERVDRTSQINRPLALPDTNEMYHPKLRLDFAPSKPPLTDVENRLTDVMSLSSRFSERSRIVVSVEGRTAILRGEVTSARERDLAELVALFEPEISKVQNVLKVVKLMKLPGPPPPVSDSEDS